jgi:hypothetical protein
MSNKKGKVQVVVIVCIKGKQTHSFVPDEQGDYESDERESSEEEQDESYKEGNDDEGKIHKRSLEALLFANEDLRAENTMLRSKISKV